MATVEREAPPMTAEAFAQRPDSGVCEELVRGRVVMTPLPGIRHGVVCSRLCRVLGNFIAEHDLGHAAGYTGVVTSRDPDSVRGADLSFYSYARLPKGERPAGYAPVPPELICEVLSPSDRWKDALEKVAEYLKAGVLVVVLLDPEKKTADVFGPDRRPQSLTADDVLRFESILPGFEVVVGRLFG